MLVCRPEYRLRPHPLETKSFHHLGGYGIQVRTFFHPSGARSETQGISFPPPLCAGSVQTVPSDELKTLRRNVLGELCDEVESIEHVKVFLKYSEYVV
jgi:hypothetical protein